MISDTEVVPPLEDVPVILEKLKLEEEMLAASTSKKQQNENKKNSSQSFCGMKKGFLFGNTSSASSKKVHAISTSTIKASIKSMETDELPTIKAQSGNSSLVLKEVQEAMKVDDPMNDFQQQISSKINNNPAVSEVLSDPEWLPILEEFQNDPEASMIKYRDNQKVRETMQELCSVLGDSFLNMNKVNVSEDEALVGKLMDNERVKDGLTDPLIEQIMVYINQGANDKVKRCLQEATPAQRSRIQVLIDHGLLSFST